ncbi:LptA/OstA family protein [Stella sp.]|uniref:LptA/OstA family protein n=1 Tax=Stella sp. TaxID=2912054 RepID=UPI0035B28BE8
MIPRLLPAALAAVVLLASPAAAQLGGMFGGDGGDKPVEILADEGIEWQQNTKAYIARGNAKAKRGDTTVAADTLTAYYRDTPKGGTEIFRVVADGTVRITSAQGAVQGDRGVYEVDRAVFVLTGGDIRLTSGTDVVTARDSLEFWEQRQLAVARGNASATREDKRIRADTLTATIGDGPKGGREVRRVDAFGNVVVATASETARAETGVYNLERGIATLRGKVRITRGQNQLNGEYAVVDLNSGVSRILPAPPRDGQPSRVTGLFVPNREGGTAPAPGATAPAAGPPAEAPAAATGTAGAPVIPARKPTPPAARTRP